MPNKSKKNLKKEKGKVKRIRKYSLKKKLLKSPLKEREKIKKRLNKLSHNPSPNQKRKKNLSLMMKLILATSSILNRLLECK